MKRNLLAVLLAVPGVACAMTELYFGHVSLNESVLVTTTETAPFIPQGQTGGDIAGGNVRLIESSLGAMIASPAGHPGASAHLLALAMQSITGTGSGGTRVAGGAEYRYGEGQNGTTSLWNIQYAGVPEFTGQANYHEALIDHAAELARVAIRTDPYHTGTGSGYALLVQAAFERLVPHSYAGNEWLAQADNYRVRRELQKTVAERMEALDQAREQFRVAASQLLEMVAHPVDSRYLWDSPDYIGTARPSWAPTNHNWTYLLLDGYCNALRQYAEAMNTGFMLQYFQIYRPTSNLTVDGLVAQVREGATEVERFLLPVAALANRLELAALDLAGPRAEAAKLKRLADQIEQRLLVFGYGRNDLDNRFSYTGYSPDDVPFFHQSHLANSSLTFNNFIEIVFGRTMISADPAGGLIAASLVADSAAVTALDQVVANQTEFASLQNELRTQYESQLVQLCGGRYDGEGHLRPDILGYLLPLEERDALAPGESYGAVGEAWLSIEQAQTRVFSAIRAFDEIHEEAQLIREYGDERNASFDRIANIQLSTGQSISALDYTAGEIRAQAISDEAEERKRVTEKKNWLSGIGKVVAGATLTALGPVTGGATWAALAAAGASGGYALYDEFEARDQQAGLQRRVGEIQAEAALGQARIQQQQTLLRAMEASQITVEHALQHETTIREQIHKLMIRVERQKLEILLARQQLRQAELEHANMLGRVNYLLGEYRRNMLRTADSTLNRPDLRLRRDYLIRRAEDRFRFAQEFSYLAAKAAEYRFLSRTEQGNVREELLNILAAQNAEDLQEAVEELILARDRFFTATGGRAGLRRVVISLRDYIVQANNLDGYRELNGTLTADVVDSQLLHYPSRFAPGGTIAEISDAQFYDFLLRHLVETTDGGGATARALIIPFPTGFEPNFADRINPLRIVGEYGHLIEGPGALHADGEAKGVFINIRNNRSSLVQLSSVTAFLEQQGMSMIAYDRIAALGSVPVRVWNLPTLTASCPVVWNQNTSPFQTPNWNGISGLGAQASAQLHERSPANERWVLRINASNLFWTQMLPTLKDIEICMTIRGWTTQGGLELP